MKAPFFHVVIIYVVCFLLHLMSFQELKQWGMTPAHRKLFMDGKSKIQLIKQEDSVLEGNSQDALNESSPALFPSSPSSQPTALLPPSQPPPLLSSQLSQGSHLSQLSTTSTQPFSQAVEVVHIQMRKNFNSQLEHF